jgi:hypothetical protein
LNDKRLFRLPLDVGTSGFDLKLDPSLTSSSKIFLSKIKQQYGTSKDIVYCDPVVIDNSNLPDFQNSKYYQIIRDNFFFCKGR